jgi:O-antigen/teichoic acid export membrane protein
MWWKKSKALVRNQAPNRFSTHKNPCEKEAFFFRVPCVTLREETEWVETVETGWNTLVGCDPERMVQAAFEARPGIESVWPYGDGQAAESQEILGNSVLLSLGVGGVGLLVGLVVVLFFRETVFPGVSPSYLLLALVLVPVEFFFSYVNYVLLGAQRIKEFNYVHIAQSVLFLAFIALALLGLKAGLTGAILAGLFTWLIVDAIVFRLALRVAGGIDLKPNSFYMKRAITYGVQAHISNILGFLNYRVDMFLVNWFLGPAAVGLYSVGVGLVERLWMVSQAASTVLFPRVAAETEEQSGRNLHH